MLDFLAQNAATIMGALLVAALLVFVIVRQLKSRKKGESSCGGSCSGCPNSSFCHPVKK